MAKKSKKDKSSGKNADTKHSKPELSDRTQKHFELFAIIALLAFGTYHSILYFGHKVVPNPDFTGFIWSARQFWAQGIPTYFKRAPMLGFLQIPLGWLVGGQHPDLTGGWLLNAVLHPCNLVLLWLLGRKIIGRAALWLAILAILNPWTIYLITEPLCETTLFFFTLLTFYLMYRRSSWCYLFAAITTMIRYEGAALILAAFVMDVINRKSKRDVVRALGYSVAASVPLGLWLLGIVLNWQGQGSKSYMKNLSFERLKTTFDILNTLWKVTFQPLFIAGTAVSRETIETVFNLTKFLAVLSFGFGVFYGILKRKWEILALLIFFVPYMVIHIMYAFSTPRFYASVHWIVLLICIFGLQSFWKIVNKNERIPKPVVIALQVVLVAVAVSWFVSLIGYLPRLKAFSPQSVWVPYVAILLVVAIYVFRRFLYKKHSAWTEAVMSVIVCAMLLSNQLVLVRVLGNGQRDIEFKRLADWYLTNSKGGEKVVCSLSNVVAIFAPKYKDCFVHPVTVKAENPGATVKRCYEQQISYVVWDSRIGFSTHDVDYKGWGLANFAMLVKPRDAGPYQYITTIHSDSYKGRYLHIFRLLTQEQIKQKYQQQKALRDNS